MTATAPTPLPERPSDSPSPASTLAALRDLPFADFARVVATLLERLGYQDVRLMGPLYGKGRNAHGGFDLRAVQGGGLTRPAVLAQIKQYREPVPRCFVDELRGAMLRQGAQQGLMVSTAGFAPAATEAAQGGQYSLPVRLLDGEELARLVAEHGVPVTEQSWSAFLRRSPRPVRRSPSQTPPADFPVPARTSELEPIRIRRSFPPLPVVPAVSGGNEGGLTVTVTVRRPGRPDQPASCR